MSRKELILLLLLAALQFTNIVDFMIMMPLGDILMKLFKMDPQKFSIIVSSYTFSAALFGFLGAFIIDRFDRKKFLVIIYIGFTLGTFACGLAPSYETLVAARIITGLFGGSISATVFAIVGDLIPVERRGAAMGVITGSFSLASVAGVPISLVIANNFGWHMPFFAIGSLSILNLVAIILILPNIKGHLEKARTINPFTAMLNLLKQPNLQKAILFMLLLVLGQFIIIPFITPYNIRNVGLLQSEVPYIYTIGGIVSIFNAPLVGRLSDKFGRKPLFFIFAIYSIIPLLWITNMQPSPLSVILISAGALFLGIGGRMIPAQTLMTQLVEPQNRGAFMSLNSSIQQLGAGLGAYIAGLIIIDTTNGKLQNYDIVGYLAVGFTILAILLFTRIKSLE